jgi:sulfonate transport system substrate-binding protein
MGNDMRCIRRIRLGKSVIKTLSILALTLLCPFSNASGGARASDETITYAMPVTVAAIPVYVAAEKGFWSDEGLKVNVQMFSAGRLALDALLSGNAQVMSVSETPLVFAMLQGHAIYIVATVTRHQETKFIGRRDQGIVSKDDLKGKTIATLPGTNSDYFMYRLLQSANISPNDVHILSLQPPSMVSALVRDDIAGYFAWEPHIYYGQQQLGDKAVVIGPDDLYRGRHCIAMNQDFVRKNPDTVIKILKGLIKAQDFVHEHPDEAKAIVAKYTNTNTALVNSLWPEYDVQVELGQELLDILGDEAKWVMTQSGSTGALPHLRDFIYTDGLLAVRPESVTIH